ncbi:hypothetical protein WLH_04059 [Escherichia coli O25b:H4]|uniref:Uncharacterized protein n=1 Tax=Escherichia coli O25b:H4 TaxID=941280 RepID=A0A192CHD0_ECO25|nr:hypothetical protein WLH_04059 [Escherichia coli O25b:H4]
MHSYSLLLICIDRFQSNQRIATPPAKNADN